MCVTFEGPAPRDTLNLAETPSTRRRIWYRPSSWLGSGGGGGGEEGEAELLSPACVASIKWQYCSVSIVLIGECAVLCGLRKMEEGVTAASIHVFRSCKSFCFRIWSRIWPYMCDRVRKSTGRGCIWWCCVARRVGTCSNSKGSRSTGSRPYGWGK